MRLSRLSLVMTCAAATWSCTTIIGAKDIFLADGAEAGPGGGGNDGGGANDGGGGGNDGATSTDGSTACGDTMSDALHCGRCNHSCLGGMCMAGQCQPVQLATSLGPRDLVVDQKHVYWIEPAAARAWQADLDGKNAIQLGGGTSNYLVGIATDGTNVFWDSRDEVMLRCAIGGCAGTPTVVTSDATIMVGAAVDATDVFWLENPSNATHVRKTAKGGSMAAATTVISLTGVGNPSHLASDGAFIYWTSDDGKVRRVPASGGTVDVVGTGAVDAAGLAVDDVNVYWSVGSTPGTINVAPKNGSGASAPLAASQNLPLGVAVDRNSVYWVNAALGTSLTSGVIMTCTIAACTPKPLAMGQRTPVAIAVDDVAIYWSNFDGGNAMGAIMKLAK